MPPFSTELWQEGAQFKSFKLVKGGKFDESGVIKMLSDDPAQYPGCSGTRTLSDVSLSDFWASGSDGAVALGETRELSNRGSSDRVALINRTCPTFTPRSPHATVE
jgi:N-methylhydantoinase B/oxoprolinase/acetone carboxylase alpha subunit